MKEAKVLAVCTSEKKGTSKKPIDEIKVKKDWGVIGDAHAGPGIRQISLIAQESHDRFQPNTDVCLKHGIFGENITTEGIELVSLPIGTRLKIGSALLEVSKIGKECHTPCSIGKRVGNCIMPKEGIFVIVIKDGVIHTDDKIEVVS